MAQKRIVVGTDPVLLADFNKNRKSISILMLPTSIESGNTGRVHIGKGFPPSNNQGDSLIQGEQITEQEQFPGDPTVFKGQWWARASIANQILIVDEITGV